MTNAEAWFNNSLRPRKPEGSLGRTAHDGHLDSHTAPELWICPLQPCRILWLVVFYFYPVCTCRSRIPSFLLFRLRVYVCMIMLHIWVCNCVCDGGGGVRRGGLVLGVGGGGGVGGGFL